MLSQIFCYWDKQQSAESNITQLHLTLKCTEDQSSHFCDCVIFSKRIFQQHHRGLPKFHAESEQLLVCVVISNSSFPTVKNNNTAYHALGKYWMQARGVLNYRLKNISSQKLSAVYVNQTNLNGKLRKRLGGQEGGQENIWGAMVHPDPP